MRVVASLVSPLTSPSPKVLCDPVFSALSGRIPETAAKARRVNGPLPPLAPSGPCRHSFPFSNRVGAELTQRLRTRTERAEVSDQERLTTGLDAAVICLAEVLRDPAAKGARPAPLIDHCMRPSVAFLLGVAYFE